MIRRLRHISFWLLVMLAAPSSIVAQYYLPNPSRYNTLEELINVFGGVFRTAVVVVLVIALMIGGWTRLTSQGDADKVAKSSKIMVAAIVGFAIIVLAPVLVDFVGRLVGVQGSLLSLGT